MAKAKNKSGRSKCADYKLRRQRDKNKIRKLKKHLKKFKNDLDAEKALKITQSK